MEKLEKERQAKDEQELRKKEETKRFVEQYLMEKEQFEVQRKRGEDEENKKIKEWNRSQDERLQEMQKKTRRTIRN